MSEVQEKKAFKFKVWQMILLPIILALIPLLYPEVKALFMRKLPQFVIEDPIITKGDSLLHIFAENGPAKKREDLNIEVEGLEFRDAGKLVRENPLEWEFNFTKYGIPETLFAEGLNSIKIGFPSSVGYDELNVYVRPDFYQKDGPVAIGTDLEPRVSFIDSSTVQLLDREVKSIAIVSNSMDDDKRVGVITSALRGQGINAAGYEEQVHIKSVKDNEIRYFNAADEKKAKALADMLKKDLKINTKIKNAGKELPKSATAKEKGVFEIVLNKEEQEQ